ncbi:MAG: hypothetical protein JXB88_26865 [Spirochaetales bacterium]|nr:hypothetical protein [Spirochaetales bacterium]
MKILIAFGLAVIVLFSFAACAAGPNNMMNTKAGGKDRDVAGFFEGLWHGIITPVTFIISLFTRDVNIYEVHNNGGWYNFGFILGLMIILGGSSGGVSKRFYVKRKD